MRHALESIESGTEGVALHGVKDKLLQGFQQVGLARQRYLIHYTAMRGSMRPCKKSSRENYEPAQLFSRVKVAERLQSSDRLLGRRLVVGLAPCAVRAALSESERKKIFIDGR